MILCEKKIAMSLCIINANRRTRDKKNTYQSVTSSVLNIRVSYIDTDEGMYLWYSLGNTLQYYWNGFEGKFANSDINLRMGFKELFDF